MEKTSDLYRDLFQAVVLHLPIHELVPFIREEAKDSSFRDFLQWNRLLPLLYHCIKQQKADDLFDRDLLNRLKHHHQTSTARTLQMQMAVTGVLNILQRENIHPFLLKGIALAHQVYANPALRPMLDIDLLFEDGQEKKARLLLLENGAKELYASESKHTMGLWQHIPPLTFKGVTLELHSHIQAAYDHGYIPLEQLTASPLTVQVNGVECRTLNATMQLYHLLVHIHKHAVSGYSRLIWLADLHWYIRKYNGAVRWDQLLNMAETARLKDIFLSYLGIVRHLLKTEMPIPAADESQTSAFVKLCRKIVPGDHQIGTWEMMTKLPANKQKILFLTGKAFPTLDYVRVKYNLKCRAAAFFYYPVLYREYWQKFWKRKD